MTLPTYDQFMLPLLKLAAEAGAMHPIAALREKLVQQFGITTEPHLNLIEPGTMLRCEVKHDFVVWVS